MITPQARAAFLYELEMLCRKYNISLTHEDSQGSFVLESFDETKLDWLMSAYVYEGRQ